MPVPSLTKQPSESRLFGMDFSSNLAQGETITGVTSVAYTGPDNALTLSGSATYSGAFAYQRIAAGTAGKRYKVTFLVTTSGGNTLEADGILQVADA